jgi:hypothetical protein
MHIALLESVAQIRAKCHLKDYQKSFSFHAGKELSAAQRDFCDSGGDTAIEAGCLRRPKV